MGIATTTTTAAVKQLSDQNSQGTVLGVTGDKISFFGASTSPVSSCVGSVTLAGATSTSANGSSIAFSSTTITAAILAAIGELKTKGLIS